MSSVASELLANIRVDDIVQCTLNESVLKDNFNAIIKILSSLKTDIGSFSSRMMNIENNYDL